MLKAAEFLDAKVPRYTSYPTAPHFHPGIDGATYREWLGQLDPSQPLSLYVHIPFCDTLCWFCGCHTTVVNRYAPVAEYCELVLQEIDLVADALGTPRRVSHLHFGGGSPTMLTLDDIARLNTALRKRFEFDADAEFAIEIDPRGFTQEMASAFAAAGLTRASIGLQDCDPIVQRAINRVQSDAETARVVHMLRELGVKSLNLDLIYGLPYQTIDCVRRTVDFAVSLAPDRLAVFGYAHVPYFKKHQQLIPESALPGLEERLRQSEEIRARLCASGYAAIGLDHFAKPSDTLAVAQRNGRLARNFQGYTTDDAPALIGLGASSIGSLPQGYVQNAPDVPTYRAAISASRLATARGVKLSDEDRLRRHVIERLMCDLKVDLAASIAGFGLPRQILDGSIEALADLRAAGAVKLAGNVLTVADAWRPAVRVVCAAFDTYLRTGAARHSLAV